MDASLPLVAAVVILDVDGQRVCAKYYSSSFDTVEKQRGFEEKLHKKTKAFLDRAEAEVVLLDACSVVVRVTNDVRIFVAGASNENELILVGVLDGLHDTLAGLLRNFVDRRGLIENLELCLLSIDEMVDNGMILELDAGAVQQRVLMRGVEAAPPMR